MQYKSESPIREACVRGKRQMHMAAGLNSPGRLPEFMHRDRELLPAFAAYYIHLRTLPRRVRRAMQRQLGMSLAGVALMLALGQTPGKAATIPVNASCTLIDAITAANTDTATAGCPAGSRADTIVLPLGSTHTLTRVHNSIYGPTGLPVISSVITIAGQGSKIVRASDAPEFFRILAVKNTGELTLQESTISGGASDNGDGGGVVNSGTLTVLNSTISVNYAYQGGGGIANTGTLIMLNTTISGNYTFQFGGLYTAGGGGVKNTGTISMANSTISANSLGAFYSNSGAGIANFGTLTMTNSTISGNYAAGSYSSLSGGVGNFGSLTLINSTITGNSADGVGGVANTGSLTLINSTITQNSAKYGVGGVANGGSLTVVRTLISGNTAPSVREIFNSVYFGGTFRADNHNLFGVNGNAGVYGFTPAPTDVVPPAGVLLNDIINPVPAFNGGPTQTHALVPGSPAIDAGGSVCTDANGDPLLTDQRGKPRIIDGNKDGKAACDIGAFEFFPLVNDLVTLDSPPETVFDPTPVTDGPAGTFTITATFTNTSGTPLRFSFFTVTELSGGNLLLNAEEQGLGVGATVTPDVGDRVFSPGETMRVDFVIGLQASTPFNFLVDLFGEPLISANVSSQRRRTAMTKTRRS